LVASAAEIERAVRPRNRKRVRATTGDGGGPGRVPELRLEERESREE
jgi:hypothetical protein